MGRAYIENTKGDKQTQQPQAYPLYLSPQHGFTPSVQSLIDLIRPPPSASVCTPPALTATGYSARSRPEVASEALMRALKLPLPES